MGRVFSLRGKLEMADNAYNANHMVFNYESPDRRRAWRVKEAWVWPITVRGLIGVDGVLGVQATLTTDIFKVATDSISDPTENRSFGWWQGKFNLRDAGDDFIVTDAGFISDSKFIIDPDQMVTKELYISMAATSDSSISFLREWGYMIVLEEEKVSAVQSLFQQIKGSGQDLDYSV